MQSFSWCPTRRARVAGTSLRGSGRRDRDSGGRRAVLGRRTTHSASSPLERASSRGAIGALGCDRPPPTGTGVPGSDGDVQVRALPRHPLARPAGSSTKGVHLMTTSRAGCYETNARYASTTSLPPRRLACVRHGATASHLTTALRALRGRTRMRTGRATCPLPRSAVAGPQLECRRLSLQHLSTARTA
jgi:hypothetical protein